MSMSAANNGAAASWSAVAERSGDTAFGRTGRVEFNICFARVKAAWRFASRRSPKYPVATFAFFA
jgi:hypothetical protein